MRSPSVIFGILAALFAYLFWSAFWPFDTPSAHAAGAVALAAIFAAAAWIPLKYWRSERDETSPRERLILWAAYGGMGWLSFLFVLSALRDLAAIVSPVALRTPAGAAWVLVASFALLAMGVLRAQFGVRLKHVRVAIPGLPTPWDGLRIVQITDLHVGPTIRRDFVQRIVGIANRAEPDLVVVTGDVADGMVSDLRVEIDPLKGLRAELGKFYVPGNHEYYWDAPAWIARMEELGFTPLLNEHRLVEKEGAKLAIAGITDPAAASMKGEAPDPAKAAAGIPGGANPRIFLCHQPHFADAAAALGFDLQLSGHTHGGQFFPWTWVASRVHKHNHGLHRTGRMSIYVSRGTGYWGPPVRFLSPPEVTLLELHRPD